MITNPLHRDARFDLDADGRVTAADIMRVAVILGARLVDSLDVEIAALG